MPISRPVPRLRGEERIYFEEANEGRLVYQRCSDCDQRIFYPRTVCPECMSESLSFIPSSGHGIVHSFTTLHVPGHPDLADEVPYTVVLVDLEEGVRIIADLVEFDPDDVEVGMTVEVVFSPWTYDLALPRFRPTPTDRRRS